MKLTRKLLALVAFLATVSFLKANDNATDTNATVADVNSTRPESLSIIDNNLAEGHALKKPFTAIYFTASWCPACRGFSPKVADFNNEYGKETNIVIVSADGNNEFYKRYSVPWLVLKKSGHKQIADLFNINYIPKIVLLDPDGQQMDRDDWKKRKEKWNTTNK
jgi:thiol-disulfide isomerase/thioredoxin